MCGIVGIISREPCVPLLVDSLKRLEYRGYDSAGIATVENGRIRRRRSEGKVSKLETKLRDRPIGGKIGIGHTRWATHGIPSEINAHPHVTDHVALVHNGIIENFQQLKDELAAEGRTFESDTDTEVVAELLSSYIDRQMPVRDAVHSTLRRLEGAFSLAVIFAGEDELMVGARRGSPLAIGYGDGEMFLGSDATALAPHTRRISYLEEGDWLVMSQNDAAVYDAGGAAVERRITEAAPAGAQIGKGGFRHYMLKEIHEQPTAIGDTLKSYFDPARHTVNLPKMPFDIAAVPRITITACGTAHSAGLVARYWLERIARIPVEIDVASELRYREAPMPEGGMLLAISQSGETADTLASLRHAREHGQHVASVVNVPNSSIARESDVVLPTKAGPEIGVASTKAFTTQLTTLACLTISAAVARGAIRREREAELSRAISEVPSRVTEVLTHDETIRKIAHTVAEARDVLYLGRGTGFPIALEGALKLKEISYIHAEGYAAGEMKHGPIALIDEKVPVIVIAPSDALFEKTASNTREVLARGGKVIFLSDKQGIQKLGDMATATVELPTLDPFVLPILYAIPVQLLAYHVAVIKGTDIDQPRNLAKSVTVE